MIRYLKAEEREKAEQLWREVFTEDSEAFLMAYRRIREDNQILGDWEGEELVAMVHANPFLIKDGGAKRVQAHYLVAVATREGYRHKGRMKRLLRRLLRDLRRKDEPFCFLMPADERIYEPLDFVTVYEQETWQLTGELEQGTGWRAASQEDFLQLAALANRLLSKRADVFCLRTEDSLLRLQQELASEGGELLLLLSERVREGRERACGYLARWSGERAPVRELICEEAEKAGWESRLSVPAQRPLIMLRLLSPAQFLAPVRCAQRCRVVLWLTDDILPENAGGYLWEIGPKGSRLKRLSTITEENWGRRQEEISQENRESWRMESASYPQFVDNSSENVDSYLKFTEREGAAQTLSGENVDILWKTTAKTLVAWRFGRMEVPFPVPIERCGRVFLNEDV